MPGCNKESKIRVKSGKGKSRKSSRKKSSLDRLSERQRLRVVLTKLKEAQQETTDDVSPSTHILEGSYSLPLKMPNKGESTSLVSNVRPDSRLEGEGLVEPWPTIRGTGQLSEAIGGRGGHVGVHRAANETSPKGSASSQTQRTVQPKTFIVDMEQDLQAEYNHVKEGISKPDARNVLAASGVVVMMLIIVVLANGS